MDADQDNILEDHEISKFMKLDLQRVSVDEAHLIVKEYDANNDGNLDFEEFCSLFLPSTD
jgi:Ca2+-binding EF-hand superfamily protein